MDPDLIRLIPAAVVVAAFGLVEALKIPERLRERNPHSLEYILGDQRVRELKRKLAEEYNCAPSQIIIEREKPYTTPCATTSRGGIIATYTVKNTAGNPLTTLYWKQDAELVQGRQDLLMNRREYNTNLTEVELCALTHRVLREAEITYVAEPLCIDPLLGVVTKQVPGTPLAEKLPQANIQTRREIFTRTLARITEIGNILRENRGYKSRLGSERSKSKLEGRRHQTSTYLHQKLEPTEASALEEKVRLWKQNPDVIHADLNPYNILITPEGDSHFVDITPDFGEWYQQAYKLQWELGLVDDFLTNKHIEDTLATRGIQNITQYQARVQAKTHLEWAAKTSAYLSSRAPGHSAEITETLNQFLIYNLEKARKRITTPARKTIDKLLSVEQSNTKISIEPQDIRARVLRYEQGIACEHPWQKIQEEWRQANNDPISTYRKQIKRARIARASALNMTYLCGFTGEITAMVAGSLIPEIISEPWYIPALLSIPLLMFLNSRHTIPYRRGITS